MDAHSTQCRTWTRCALMLGVTGAAVGLFGQAVAACGSFEPRFKPPVQAPFAPAGLIRAAWRPEAVAFIRVDDPAPRGAGIVGTWRFTWTSDGTAYPNLVPVGAVVHFGTQQWHDDGTEFIISGARPPGSGDTCMGSGEQTGPSTYRFKHIALAWANGDSMPPATPAVFVGPAIMRATVALNHARDTFEGHFTLDQCAKGEATLPEHIAGAVTATRFSVD